MKIPVYEQQIAPNAPTPQTPNLPAPLASASMSSVHEANARLGQTLSNVGEKLAAHAIEFQKEQNETELFKQDIALGDKIQATLTDPDKGILTTLKLGKAATATTSFNDFSKATLDEIDAMEVPDVIKRPLRERAMTRLATAKSAVVTHQQQQLEEDHRLSFNANIANQKRALGYAPNAQAFLDGRNMIHATIIPEIKRMGFTEGTPAYEQAKANLLSAADEDALKELVGGKLADNPTAALKALAPFEGKVDAVAFNKVKAEAQKNAFASTVLSSKMAGMGKDEILAKYVATEKDANLQADKMEMVNRAFATTEPFTYRELFRGVKDGTIQDADIDGAFNAGKISQGDWEGLWKAKEDGRGGKKLSPEMKIALDNVELMVNDKYPSKQKRAEAMYVLEQKALAFPNPDVFQAEAKKSLDGVVVSPAIFHDSDEHGWKDELDAMRQDSADRAVEVDKAMSVLRRMGKKLSPANVDNLINYWRTNPNDKRSQ